MNISIIGFGNMAKALCQGLLHNKLYQLTVSAPSLTLGTNADGIHTHFKNTAIIADADIIILAVKPKDMNLVLSEINQAISTQSLIISVASGLSLSYFDLKTAGQVPIVRAMPNIAASIGQSATPLFANAWVTGHQKTMVEQLFLDVGIITWLAHEEQMDAFTALSGSGPAYVLLFMEAMIKAGISLGIAEDIAREFTLQTVAGTLSLAMQNDQTLAKRRASVTSPAGTTAAGLNVLDIGGFEPLLIDAIKAAYERAQLLGVLK